jgi:hypothetical protein
MVRKLFLFYFIYNKWIPQEVVCTPYIPGMGLSKDAIVADLIDKDTRWWNSTLLAAAFEEDTVAKMS